MLKKLINFGLVLSMAASLVCVGTAEVSADEATFTDPTTTTGIYKTLYRQDFNLLGKIDEAGFTLDTPDDGTGDNEGKKSDEWTLKSEGETEISNKYLNWKRNFATTGDKTIKHVFAASGYTSGRIVASAKIKVNIADGDTTGKYFEMGTTPSHWGGIANKFQICNISSSKFELYVTAKNNARVDVNEDMVNSFCRIDFVQDLDTNKADIYVNGKLVMNEIPVSDAAVNTLSLCMRKGTSSADIDIDDLFVGKELAKDPQTTGEYKQIYKQDFNSLNTIEDAKFTLTNAVTDSSTINKDVLSLKTDSGESSNKYLNLKRDSALSTEANISKEFYTQTPPNTIVFSAKLKVNSGTGNIELATGGTAYTHLNKFQIADISNGSFKLKYADNNKVVTVNEDIKNSFVRFDYIQNLSTLKGEIYVNGDLVVSDETISLRASDRQWLNAWDIVVRGNSPALDMDIDDIYVGKKIPEYEITEITKTETQVTGVKLNKGVQSGVTGRTLYVAVFDSNKVLKAIAVQSVDDVEQGLDKSVNLTSPLDIVSGDTVKAMIWNEDLSPVWLAK